MAPTVSSRWLAPVAAAALVVGGPAVASLSADRVDLPPRTAEQLLVDLADVDVDAWSGTVRTRADLGLPSLPGLGDEGGLGSLLDGEQTLRVWQDGPTRSRVALLSERGETNVVRNDRVVWSYSSLDRTGTLRTLPEPRPGEDGAGRAPQGPDGLGADGAPVTPDLLAQTVLLTLDQSSDVTVDGAQAVAGRDAYELVVTPRSTDTLVDSVRLAVDAETSLPLRVQVFARGTTEAALQAGFTDIDLGTPDADVFDVTPPEGAEVERVAPKPGGYEWPSLGTDGDGGDDAAVQRYGTSFDTVVVGEVPEQLTAALAAAGGSGGSRGSGDAGDAGDAGDPAATASALDALPEVSGGWGSGRLLRGTLFSVVLTDDGRVAAGAVTPQALYAALTR